MILRMVRPPRLELGTNGFEAHYSIQLSYGRTAARISDLRFQIPDLKRYTNISSALEQGKRVFYSSPGSGFHRSFVFISGDQSQTKMVRVVRVVTGLGRQCFWKMGWK